MDAKPRLVFALSLVTPLLAGGAARAQLPTTTRVSVGSTGVEADYGAWAPAISADGRFVAFASASTNLVAGDLYGAFDVFVHDRVSGTTERVSVSTGGEEGEFDSAYPSISADGRFVAFSSDATNLVAGDTNARQDVFVRDRAAGTTERVSLTTVGVQANHHSNMPAISADGRFVAFGSRATNLDPVDTNGLDDIYVRDRLSGTTELVSVDPDGYASIVGSGWASISADGRFVAFASRSWNLVPGDTNNSDDIFVRDRQSGVTERVSVDSVGTQANLQGSGSPHISSDGRFVAFYSFASNLVVGDTNGTTDIFVHDRSNGGTERVSVDSAGAQTDSYSLYPVISENGRFVAFQSQATNLVAGDFNGTLDIFVHERSSGVTERVSVDSAGVEGDQQSGYPQSGCISISADGRFVAFNSYATNLVAGDTNGASDIFVRDCAARPPTAYCTSSTSSNGCVASIAADANPSLSFAHACHFTVTNVEGQKSGILFYGIDNSGFSPGPWAAGSTSLLCVKHPTQRTSIQNSGGTFGACDGSFVLDWNAYQSADPFALGNPWSVDAKVYAQAWFRDPFAAKATNLSNAIELTYVP